MPKRNHTPSSKLSDSKLLRNFRISEEECTTLLNANYQLESLSGEVISRTVTARDELVNKMVVLTPGVWTSKWQKSIYDERELSEGAAHFVDVQPDPVSFVEGQALYTVVAILESRIVKERREVLVKWAGFESPSWRVSIVDVGI